MSTASFVHAQLITAGGAHNCASTAAGGVVCWGINANGQLGDGTTIARSTPANVSSLPFGSIALAAGASHSCAVTSTGAVKCWGGNAHGQLGDNSIIQSPVPVDVSGLSGITRVIAGGDSSGQSFSCALSTTGGVQCWGSNNDGQLGNGTIAEAHTPAPVSGLGSGVTALSAGYAHACAVNAGAAVCWGANYGLQLGDGSTANFQIAPVSVTGLTSGVASVAAGSDHSCALLTTGGVKCWGDNAYGAIGIATSGTTEPAPMDVFGLNSGVSAVTAGQYHTCALTVGGGVKCWGQNSSGQIGDGTNTDRNTPVDVIASGVIAVAAGAQHTCALLSTGVSSCWGNNPNGQMGNGTFGGQSYVPVATQYPAATSTALVSNLNPSLYGENVTFTATVTGGLNGTAVAFRTGSEYRWMRCAGFDRGCRRLHRRRAVGGHAFNHGDLSRYGKHARQYICRTCADRQQSGPDDRLRRASQPK
ncbi:MAG: chromosome condensation regulator RCC1 [Betaproteobacteria bacterium]|nr:chromosome condensation regulator RCC1 [Betaproteobacteria bacterium]